MKKIYEKPATEVVEVELEKMIANSVGINENKYDGQRAILGKERNEDFGGDDWGFGL